MLHGRTAPFERNRSGAIVVPDLFVRLSYWFCAANASYWATSQASASSMPSLE